MSTINPSGSHVCDVLRAVLLFAVTVYFRPRHFINYLKYLSAKERRGDPGVSMDAPVCWEISIRR